MMPTPDVTLDLMEFVEQNILPRYAAFDKAHRLPHITRIIRRALELAKKIGADCNMTYVAAAYHDLGLAGPRAVHHLTSGKILGADARLRRWFTSQQIKIMKEAVEDHRASASHAPRNIYGKIIAEANRDLEPDVVFRRTVEYGLDRYPEKNKEAQWKRFISHLESKYSTNGYVRLWIPNSPNEANLKKIREIINDKTLLRERFEQIYESAPAADPPICP